VSARPPRRPAQADLRQHGLERRPEGYRPCKQPEGRRVIILGIILLLLGFIFSINILWVIGIVLVIIGAILWILGSMDRAVGGRRHYY
jgi:hypothetical protein